MNFDTPIGKTIFPVNPLGDGCEFISGYAFKGKDFIDSGNPVIKIKNIQNGKVTTEESQFVSDDVITRKLYKFKLDHGDILIAMTGQGSVGRVGRLYISKNETPYLNQRVGKFSADEITLNKDFLYYIVSSKAYENYLFAAGSGSGQPNLSPAIIKSVEIPYPPYDIQCRIGKGLKDLDDKIELNTQTNQTIEQIAQAIFKSWFVDFDPVKAKIEILASGGSAEDAELAAMSAISAKTTDELHSLKNSNSDAFNKLAQTAALFPAAMQDSELGEIPKGWEAVQVGKILQRLKSEKRYTKKQVEPYGQTPVYEQGASILLGFHNDDAGFKSSPEDPIFIFGDHTCITHLSCSKFDISSNVIPLKGSIRPTIWTYYAIKGKQEFQEYRRHWSELIIKDVVLPSVELTEEYTKLVTSKYLMIDLLMRQSKELEQLRDTLLPKLLSGEIDLTRGVAL